MVSAAEQPIMATIRIVFQIVRYNGSDYLNLVQKAFREKRPYGPVYKTAGENFFFRGFGFAFEKSPGYLSGGVGSFLIVNREREKVLRRIGGFGANYGAKYCCLSHSGHYCSVGLTGYLAGFQYQFLSGEIYFLAVNSEHYVSFLSFLVPEKRTDRRSIRCKIPESPVARD
jgi:hypothetical protein